jgi:hypothetical protein
VELSEAAQKHFNDHNGDVSLIEMSHHLAAGMKTFMVQSWYFSMDEVRQSLGGAGYSLASGIAQLWIDGSSSATYEGTPVILNQQSAKYLYKQLKAIEKDKTLKGVFTYMNDMQLLLKAKCSATNVTEFLSFKNLTRTLQTRAAFNLQKTWDFFKNPKIAMKVKANELYATLEQKMVRSHISYVMYQQALDYILNHRFTDDKIPELLLLMVKVFAVKQIMLDTQPLYACGYFERGAKKLLDEAFTLVLAELRPHMVPLTEAFTIDAQDFNVIGNKYGDIYELQLETAKASRLNRTAVPPYYEKFMKPTMTMHKAKL